MRHSRQREVILGILRRERRHYSAAEIYGLAREELPDVSLGTVYRNLGKLCEEGREPFNYTAFAVLLCRFCSLVMPFSSCYTAFRGLRCGILLPFIYRFSSF